MSVRLDQIADRFALEPAGEDEVMLCCLSCDPAGDEVYRWPASSLVSIRAIVNEASEHWTDAGHS